MQGPTVSDEQLVADWSAVRAGVARVQRRLDDVVEGAGVPPQWFAVLHLLLNADELRLPMSVLARETFMTSGGFTKLADRMAQEGLIDRRSSAKDRRVVNAALTAEGQLMALQALQRYAEQLRTSVLSAATATEFAVAAATLRSLGRVNSVDEADEAAPAGQPEPQERGDALPERRRRRPVTE